MPARSVRPRGIRIVVPVAMICLIGACYALTVPATAQARQARQVATEAAAGQAVPASGATVWSGAYRVAQARRGETASIQKCVICHGEDLLGNEAPALVGPDFLVKWYTQTVWDFFDRLKKTMPAGTPGSLTAQESADLVAYILSQNGFPAGEKELPSDMRTLSQILITRESPAK